MASPVRRPAVLEHPRARRSASGPVPPTSRPPPGHGRTAGCSGAGEQQALSTAGGQQPVSARTCAAAAGLQASVQRPAEGQRGSMQQRAGRLVQPLHPAAAAAHPAPVQRPGRSEAALQRAGPARGEDEVQRRVPGERGRAIRLRRQAVRTGPRALPLGKESPHSGWSARGPGFTRSPGEPRPHGRPRRARSSGPRRKRDRTAGNRPSPLRFARRPSPTPGQVPPDRGLRALGAAVPETGHRRWNAAAPAQSEAGESGTAGQRRSLAAPKGRRAPAVSRCHAFGPPSPRMHICAGQSRYLVSVTGGVTGSCDDGRDTLHATPRRDTTNRPASRACSPEAALPGRPERRTDGPGGGNGRPRTRTWRLPACGRASRG